MVALIWGCGFSEKKDKEVTDIDSSTERSEEILKKDEELGIPVFDYAGLRPMLYQEDDKTYVINFWATWCAPCIKELPHFEKINAEYSKNTVEVILVSLDMPSLWQSHLVPFIKDKELKSQVVILDDPKQNDWIPKVDEAWSGAIPATIIYNKNKREFYEQSFTYDELKNALNNFVKS